MNKTIISVLILAVASLGLSFYALDKAKEPVKLGMVNASNVFYADNATTTQQGGQWISTAAVQLIPRDDGRQFARLSVAPYSTSTVWVWQATSTDLVVASQGIAIHASTTSNYYQIDSDNLYRGEIQVISDGDTYVSWISQ